MNKEEEYKELFLSEAVESYETLSRLFTNLEKNTRNPAIVNDIFRITHTLKGNAMGLGFTAIAELSHLLEDIFNEIKNGKLLLDPDLFSVLFKGVDKLGELINALRTNEKVNYKGIKTRLEVYINKLRAEMNTSAADENTEASSKVNDTEIIIEEEIKLNPPEDDTVQLNEEAGEDIQEHKITLNDVVQVPVRKLDSLLNIVGELIIEKDSLISKFQGMLNNRGSDFARLHRITSDLQYGIMDIRLIQVGFMFNKFHRIVRDVAAIEGKKVNLVLEGTEIEIDRNVIKVMSDSLVHLVRNAVSHGIEAPAKRLAGGKNETGTITLKARNEKDTVFIEVSDDGSGIDPARIRKKAVEKGLIRAESAEALSDADVINLIFEPGFSNADTITEVSGRGVGMDVVKRATETIGGKIDIKTEVGKGSAFILSLPSSMAVKGALLFELDKQEYAIPLNYTEAVISLRKKDFHRVNNSLVASYLGKSISIVFLKDLFRISKKEGDWSRHSFALDALTEYEKVEVIIVSYTGRLVGIVVDKLLQQKEIVEKTLSEPVNSVELISGATILGNGNVCLVLDVASILRSLFREKLNHQQV